SNTTLTSPISPPPGFDATVYGVGNGATLTFDLSGDLASRLLVKQLLGGATVVNNGAISIPFPYSRGIATIDEDASLPPITLINNGSISMNVGAADYAIQQGAFGNITNNGSIVTTAGQGIYVNTCCAIVSNTGTIDTAGIGVNNFNAN